MKSPTNFGKVFGHDSFGASFLDVDAEIVEGLAGQMNNLQNRPV